jgi:threonine synthase
MRYLSTRGVAEAQSRPFGAVQGRSFCEILLEGLAPDGGLYLPVSYPKLTATDLERLNRIYLEQGYAQLAFEVLSLFIDDIKSSDLHTICHKTYTEQVFGSKLIVPVRPLEQGIYLQALSNGPTLAFKDMAMQLLGNLFEYRLAQTGQQLNILGATSGDTGSAAEYAMRGKKGVRVFMTSPKDRMSTFQQAQMFSLLDENIFNIAIEGVFDDCQDIVKAVSGDLAFKAQYSIGTVNSINWARLVAQVVYYFAGYFQVTSLLGGAKFFAPISFTVPSGNFGNVCAGHVARMMGLPIDRLVVATNENDVLDEFFKTGVYRVRTSANTLETSSPSMDISKASNFERFIFDLLDRDAQQSEKLFAREIPQHGNFDLSADERFLDIPNKYGFLSGRSTHADRLNTIRRVYEEHHEIIDPHTADGLKVAREVKMSRQSAQANECSAMVVLETALPIKFAATTLEALGTLPPRPPKFEGIEELPRRVHHMPANVDMVKNFIQQHCH